MGPGLPSEGTPRHSVVQAPALTATRLLASFAFVVIGLAGRALIDKFLAIQGGAVAVAGWAQLASVAEVVSGASLTGVGTALTVLSAGCLGSQMAWLKPALWICLSLSSLVAVLVWGALRWLAPSMFPGQASLLPLALAAGGLAVAPGLLVALLLGIGRPGRATAVIALGFLPPLLCLWRHPWPSPLMDLLAGQIAFGLVAAIGLVLLVRGQPPVSRQALLTLVRFLPAGLAIGILSPASTAWARAEIAGNLSWQAAGHVQAIWRTSEWSTAVMAGLLNAHFLPRLSAAADHTAFAAELKHAAVTTVLPAALLLVFLWLSLPDALTLLYRADIHVSRREALFFLMGDWLRIISWVALIGLFARHLARAITLGEFFSLPLFALLLTLFSGSFGVREVGMIWLLTYAIYSLFNSILLWRSLRPG